jgi:UDP-N-acetylglucosamine--N-acetylmuramyl-(pentapeptide) pyrophosphoryl-undecaprenol N-acetylglucosamine transferase
VKFAPQATSLLADFDATIPVHRIASGKLRRYHHLTLMQQLLWPRLVLLNIRDSFFAAAGFVQSFIKLLIWRPDVVFTKGGYVCLPVGIAAHILRIPLVIHDSDAHPGLTNRMLARWASRIATGAPLEYYSYPKAISRYVGIPISDEFHLFSPDERMAAKSVWRVDVSRPLIVVTGGGLGAQRINDTTVLALPELLKMGSVILISGAAQHDELKTTVPQNDTHFQLHAFVSSGMAQLLGAADVVVTRAGATTILELAALARPTILIPNGKLTGGHQLKNAKVYADADAVKIVDETDMMSRPSELVICIAGVLGDPSASEAMARRLAAFARPDAARNVADMILDAAS